MGYPENNVAAWDVEVDVVVFGSGAGGLSASLFGAKKGLEVLLCEKTGQVGGTTATSGGVAWIPGNDKAREAGVEDSREAAVTYLRAELGNHYRAHLIDAFLDSGPDAIRVLETDTEVRFDYLGWPDYHPDQPGAAQRGRSVVTRPFDARKLGRDFALVRPPMHRFMIFGGLSIGADEVPHFLKAFTSLKSFAYVVRKVARYAADRLRNSRGTDVQAGNALVSRLFYSLRQLQVPVWLDSPLEDLIVEDGRVVGALVNQPGGTRRVRARRAVVLATGGFPRNAQMREAYGADMPHRFTLAFEGDTGDGVRAAQAVGGGVDMEPVSPGLWTPASVVKGADGREEPAIYGYLDRGRPGVIAVNRKGLRFVNEANSYHDIVMAMFDQGVGRGERFWFVCDRAFVRRHGLGVIRPSPLSPSLRPFIRSGYINTAGTVAELARKIEVDVTGLEATVARHNDFAKTGLDLDFGKGGNVYNRLFGDSRFQPNPNLAPIIEAPFVALEIHAATLGAVRGLKTDGDARVLSASGAPIEGLYACGNELASVMRGVYPGGGVTIGPAITFAYRAVEHAATQ
jgi:3-oxosteroid 1-dehydrogenase